MAIKVYISGITTEEALIASVSSNVHYLSAVFNKQSASYILPQTAADLFELAPSFIKKIAIFENPTESEVLKTLKVFNTDLIQLEGNEDRQFIASLKNHGLSIIKAVYLDNENDNEQLNYYGQFVDYFLVCGHRDIRNGHQRVWAISDFAFLKMVKFNKPWFLGGELNKLNVKRAVHDSQASMISVSSSLEMAPGVKDPDLIKEFVRSIYRPST